MWAIQKPSGEDRLVRTAAYRTVREVTAKPEPSIGPILPGDEVLDKFGVKAIPAFHHSIHCDFPEKVCN
jgi:hypothetical protein